MKMAALVSDFVAQKEQLRIQLQTDQMSLFRTRFMQAGGNAVGGGKPMLALACGMSPEHPVFRGLSSLAQAAGWTGRNGMGDASELLGYVTHATAWGLRTEYEKQLGAEAAAEGGGSSSVY